LSDRLGDAAVNLAIDQHRVYRASAIIDRDVAEKLNIPRLTFHFHHAHVGPKRKGEVLWLERCSCRQARLESIGCRSRPRALGRNFGEWYRLISASERTVRESHCRVRRSAEQVASENLHLLQHPLHRAHDRGAAQRHVATAEGPDAVLNLSG